jgi:8-oxo-dGTP diphosphatase
VERARRQGRPGESLAAAVVREVAEETGVAVEVGPLVEVVERIGAEHHYVILDYLATRARRPRPGRATTPGPRGSSPPTSWPELPLTDGLAPVLAKARAIAVANRASPR